MEAMMLARHRTIRLLLQISIACLALAALPVEAGVAPSATAVRIASQKSPPPQDGMYQQLIEAANAVVGVKVTALPNARSNDSLGQERNGSGVVIRTDGLVLTIGYLILEADRIEVSSDGQTVPAAVVAYDHATGFGLVRPMAPLALKPIRIGTAGPVGAGPVGQLDRLMIVTGGEEQTISVATVVSKRKFAGYWEYLIDGAIFTSPPRLDHSGAALINKDGELVGIGSLFVMDALTPGERLPGNMFVPVDLLKPLLAEMRKTGAYRAPRRPWLGVNSLEEDGRVKVMQVNEDSPADEAGIVAGDIILSVDGQPVENLEKFYNTLWRRGVPNADVSLMVLHGPNVRQVIVRSIDREEFVRRKPGV
jgi:S1-C subfamily serine protease